MWAQACVYYADEHFCWKKQEPNKQKIKKEQLRPYSGPKILLADHFATENKVGAEALVLPLQRHAQVVRGKALEPVETEFVNKSLLLNKHKDEKINNVKLTSCFTNRKSIGIKSLKYLHNTPHCRKWSVITKYLMILFPSVKGPDSVVDVLTSPFSRISFRQDARRYHLTETT